MIGTGDRDLSGFSMYELFRNEAESQLDILTQALLALERAPHDVQVIGSLMRAAHSIKGAASIVNLRAIVRLAHGMEDCMVAAQHAQTPLSRERVDTLLVAIDLITHLIKLDENSAAGWLSMQQDSIDAMVEQLSAAPHPVAAITAPLETLETLVAAAASHELAAASDARPAAAASGQSSAFDPGYHGHQMLKVNARNFDRLLSLASEARVAALQLQPFLVTMQRLRKKQGTLFKDFEQLHDALASANIPARLMEKSRTVLQDIHPLAQQLVEHITELEAHERRLVSLSQGMFDEVLAVRMRPFRDGVQAFPRMVRDLARQLGKEIRLKIIGEATLVDRNILAQLESPLNHILRNGIDHGLELPEQRVAAGKPREGVIRLEARHSAGMLSIDVCDDGQGVDLNNIRSRVITRGMASEQMAANMSSEELLDFLFLPAFSLKESTNELSGRGVGLDVVHDMIRQQYGTVKIESEPGRGFKLHITLPLSQSMVRTLVVDIGGEFYALPITRIERVLTITHDMIESLEDKPFFTTGAEHIGLVSAAQLLELGTSRFTEGELPVVVIGAGRRRYGLVVDAAIGEQSLTVHPIEPIFGKMRDISSASLLDDGTPVLILDVADMLVSIEKLLIEGGLQHLRVGGQLAATKAKRVLVVDDSMTVREMERKLLAARGFAVDVAIDGIDGWNAVRSNDYDLVITDVDMPRMDGIELVSLIKKDVRLQHLPVMIVSYKDRPEDRARGIEVGADYYLTKGSFHDETLLEAVYDLIGESGV